MVDQRSQQLIDAERKLSRNLALAAAVIVLSLFLCHSSAFASPSPLHISNTLSCMPFEKNCEIAQQYDFYGEESSRTAAHSCSWSRHIASTLRKLVPGVRFETQTETWEDTSSVLAILSEKNGPLRLQIGILDTSTVNAFALPRTDKLPAAIYLTHGLLSELKTDSELAFVLAHELAHIRGEHFSPSVPAAILSPRQIAHMQDVHKDWELAADGEALMLLTQGRFDTSAALTLLRRIAVKIAPIKDNFLKRHPTSKQRFSALRHGINGLDFAFTLQELMHTNPHAAER